jgi:hypothetical protein
MLPRASLFAAIVALGASLVACIVEPVETYGSGSTYAAPTSGPPGAAEPMLVEVDTGRSMAVEAGQGVGAFVEYRGKGLWHLSWTCDTLSTSQECPFLITVRAQSGGIDKVASVGAPGVTLGDTTMDLTLRSTTTTELHAVEFQTDPGATVELDVMVGSLHDGAILFFVQNGLPNGGYEGKVTNPLLVRGSTP